MIEIVFHNLKKSELLANIVRERLQALSEKFPDLQRHRVIATVSMDNSPQHAGADLFGIRVFINGRKFKNITLEKSRFKFTRLLEFYVTIWSIVLAVSLQKFVSKTDTRHANKF